MSGLLRNYFFKFLGLVCFVWTWLLDLWLVLKPCRFSVISLVFGFVFFGIAPQGIDILRAMMETGRGNMLSFLLFYSCIWLWALSIWYWARHMLRFEKIYNNATATQNKARAMKMVEEVPRALGALAFWSLWFAVIKSGAKYPDDVQIELAIDPDWFAYIYFYSGIIFYIFVKIRRLLFGKKFQLLGSEQLHQEFINKFTQMPTIAKVFAEVLVVVSLLAFIWTTMDPVGAASLGTSNLLLIAAANWVFIGSIMVFYSEKYRVPIFLILLVLAFVFSAWNDNHIMRTRGELVTDTRSNIDTHFTKWLAPRLQQWQQNPANQGVAYPLFLVAAEGGGIRAAYWTATVLGAFQDANNQFSDHVYLMSGVSGGSLGIATYTAMLKANNEKANVSDECLQAGRFSYQACAHAFLQNDFLAPPAGRMLYGDLLQRFIPFPVASFDRAAAIEKAWESSWERVTGTDYFDQPFLDLYAKENKAASTNLPVMFLNGTWVEKGFRTVTSNVQIGEKFQTVKDLHRVTKKKIRLSTAIHNSARFTYVSPAATVKDAKDEVWGHVVDGGYFENSGTVTLAEAFHTIKASSGSDWSKIRPVVLMITNDPHQDDAMETDSTPLANEVMSPLNAMLNTRNGRGSLARAQMKEYLGSQGVFKEIGLQHVTGPVPLGWMLSHAAMNTMDTRMKCYIEELKDSDPLKISAGQQCNSGE